MKIKLMSRDEDAILTIKCRSNQPNGEDYIWVPFQRRTESCSSGNQGEWGDGGQQWGGGGDEGGCPVNNFTIWSEIYTWQNVLTWSVPSDLMFKIYTSLDKITWCNASFDEMIWSVPSDLMLKICISLDNYHHMKQRWRTRNILAATWPPSTSFEMMYKIYTFLCNLHFIHEIYIYVPQNIEVGILHSAQSNQETQTCPCPSVH